MEEVPVEVAANVASFLSKSDLKLLRLTCKAFAIICEEHLFANLEYHLRPREDSLRQFEELSKHPRIPQYLETLSCDTGVLSENDEFRVWKAAVIQEKWNSYTREHSTPWGGQDLDETKTFHNNLDASFSTEMEESFREYRLWLDYEALVMTSLTKQRRLLELMTTLRPKKRYKVTLQGFEVPLSELQYFHNHKNLYDLETARSVAFHPKSRERVRRRRTACVVHFLQYCRGISDTLSANPTLDQIELVLKGFPVEVLPNCFGLPGPEIRLPEGIEWDQNLPSEALKRLFTRVPSVDILFRGMPHSDSVLRQPQDPNFETFENPFVPEGRNELDYDELAHRFAESFIHPAELEKWSRMKMLKLTFGLGVDSHLSNILIGYYTRLPTIPLFHYASLHELSINRFTLSKRFLERLLQNQSQIRRLSLKNGSITSLDSLIDFLHVLREKGDLENICIEGRWKSPGDGVTWKIFNEQSYCEDNPFDSPFPAKGLKWQVEQYILHGGPCPLKSLNEDPRAKETWDLLSDASWHFSAFDSWL